MAVLKTGWKRLHWSAQTGLVLVSLYLVYVVLGFFALPPLARNLLQTGLSERLDRKVVIEKIRFNPLVLRAQILGLGVYAADNATLDLSLASLEVDAEVSSLVRRGLVLKKISLDSPYAFVRILDNLGGNNLQDMFAGKDAEPDQPLEGKAEDQKPASPFPVIVEGFFCHNGTMRIQDDPKSSIHVIDRIALTVPFFSSRLADREIQVQPLLRFRLNDTPFELKGTSVPFASSRRTEFDLSEAGLDLTRFWSYVPIGPSLSLSAGRFTSKASLVFEQTPEGEHPFMLFIRGDFDIDDVHLNHVQDGIILRCRHARAELKRFRLLPREAVFGTISLDDPFLALERRNEGALNWEEYLREVRSGNRSASTGSQEENGPSLRIMADAIRLNHGKIRLRDRVPEQEFITTLDPLDVRIHHLDTAINAATAAELTLKTSHGESLAIHATLVMDPFACNGTLAFENGTIPTYSPYFAPFLPLEVARGKVDLATSFQVVTGDMPKRMLSGIQGRVAELGMRVPGSSQEILGFKTFGCENGTIDLEEHRVGFSRLSLTNPRLMLERNAQNEINLLTLLAPSDKETLPSEDIQATQDPTPAVPWTVGVDSVQCTGGDVQFTDRAAKQVAMSRLQDIDVTLRDVGSDLNSTVGFELATRVNGSGRIQSRGTIVPATLNTRGNVLISKLGLPALTPYLPASVQVDVSKGLLDCSGTWDLRKEAGVTGKLQGDLEVAGVECRELGNKNKLFGFSSLNIEGIDFRLDPNTLRMGSVVMRDPRTFLVKDEDGVLNMARVLGGGGTEQITETPPEAEPADVPQPSTDQPSFFKDIHVDTVRIVQGGVAFHDHSLSPDFTANLGQINARVTNVSLDPSQKAALDLNATLNNHAPLSLQGNLSPLRRPLASDLAFRLSHMDMTSLTPYTIKSLAYPVLKGKLNWNGRFMTENYVLDASNTFFVEQFELGEKVDSPDAVSVPIKLGLALLQDGNGDLTLDVPVHGELNDPQFRLGGVIFKAIIGIFSKIVTAPFALLGNMFGGGEDLSHLGYLPGSFALSPQTMAKLDTVTKALQERPGLRVFVTGLAERETDRKGLEEQVFMRKLRVQKYIMLEKDGNVPAAGVNAVDITPDEYEKYLFLAYKAEPGKKPRRFGRVQKLSVEEMDAVVREDIAILEDDLLELANKRSQRVREYLLEKGGIAPDRVFVTSSKLLPPDGKMSGLRVDLSLGK